MGEDFSWWGLGPLLALGLGVLLLAWWKPDWGWRKAALRALVLWAMAASLAAEVLGALRRLDTLVLRAGWGSLVVLLGLSLLWRARRARPRLGLTLPRQVGPAPWVIAGTLAVTGWLAWRVPPQTWDSLNYHMSRVAHWAQNGSLAHYATGIEVQNSMPPGAEVLSLHLYLTGGGDRLVNFVSWLAMVGSVLAVARLAAQLGGGRRTQWFAAVVAATLPMGIIQASSTMTDYVVALWTAIAVSELLEAKSGGDDLPLEVALFGGGAAGLAVYTKPTAMVYLLPLALVGSYWIWRRYSLRGALALGALALVVVLGLNAGHWLRNLRTYGDPWGGSERIAQHGNQLLTFPALISNVTRNAALHLGTPDPRANKALALSLLALHDVLGLDPSDPRTTDSGAFRVRRTTAEENHAGNLVHALLLLAVLLLLALRRPRLEATYYLYLLAVLSTFILFSLLFKWIPTGSRLHLPFFILASPALAVALSALLPSSWSSGLALLLFLGALPYLLAIPSRPLLAIPGAPVGSVLQTTREDLLFASAAYLQEPYTALAGEIRAADCRRVGLMLRGNGAEYPLWVLLGASDAELDMEWIVSDTPSARYVKKDFAPCAIICEQCPEAWTRLRGLTPRLQRGGFRLYQ